jgi:hypothetical protein
MKIRTLTVSGLAAILITSQLAALVLGPNDVYTGTSRIDSATRQVEPLVIFEPTGIFGDDNSEIIRSIDGQSGKLWRVDRFSGKRTLLAEGSNLFTGYGQHIISEQWLGEIFLPVGNPASPTILAYNLQSGATRTFAMPGIDTVRMDLAVITNGRIVGIADGGDGVVMVLRTGEPAASPGGLSGHVLKALARTQDIRLFGATSTGASDVGLVDIDFETGLMSPVATLPGIDRPSSHLRLVATPGGDFYLSVSDGFSDSSLYRVNGDTYSATEIPLPDGIVLDGLGSLELDADANLLVGTLDLRPQIPGGVRVFLRMYQGTHDTQVIAGHAGAANLPLGHMTHVQDGVLYYVPALVDGLQDRVMRMDVRTGAVSVVTSSERSGSILTRARQIAVNGSNLYVLEEDTGQDTHLIRVNALTGSQTYLANLGNGLMVQYLIYEPRTGYLLMSAIGGHPDGGFGTVLQVWPEAGAQPEAITDLPFAANPRGLTVADDGTLYVVGSVNGNRLYKVNRITGDWFHLSNSAGFQNPVDVELSPAGDLLVLDSGRGSIMRVNPDTGATTTYIQNVPSSTYLVKARTATDPPPKPFTLVTGADPYGDNWFHLDWYGWFNASGNWLLHVEHGWQFFGGGVVKSLYFYDAGLGGWIWTNPTSYPYIYAFDPHNDWLLYLVGGMPADRWFYSFAQDRWLNVTAE